LKTLSPRSFATVTDLFHRVSGIRLGPQKQALVAGRLQKLADESGERDLDRYVERLSSGHAPAEEMTRLVDRLTTNETYFFREPQHFDDLARRADAAPPGEYTVWSAASSSGEEAYSIAMVLAESRGSSARVESSEGYPAVTNGRTARRDPAATRDSLAETRFSTVRIGTNGRSADSEEK
jgi:chemotaxis methyl-accepting protein methylase